MASAALQSFARKLTVIVYFVIVLLPVMLLGYDGPWLGEGDVALRGRTDFPQRLRPGSFQQLDKWFADRVGLRYPLIYLGTEFHLGMLGRPLDRHVFFGPDNWMFWTEDADRVPSTMADSRGRLRFTPAEVARIGTELKAARDRLAACNIPFFVAIAPNKQGLYPEHVMNLTVGAPQTRFDAMLAALDPTARGMIVDLRQSLRAAKQAHAPMRLYNKTETHWNDLGAFHAYVQMMDALRGAAVRFANPELMALSQYNVTTAPYRGGDIANVMLFSPWRFPDVDVSVARKSMAALSPEQELRPRVFISRNPHGEGRLLLIGDSFTGAVARFLQQNFAEVIRYVSVTVDGAMVSEFKPDAVLVLAVERNLERLLLPLANSAQVCPAR